MKDIQPERIRIVKLPLLEAQSIFRMNTLIFGEERLINHFEHDDIRLYEARVNGIGVGFKMGYALSSKEYYSAKGGVLEAFRRKGIAEKLTFNMIMDCKKSGYKVLSFDTLPDLYPGMMELGKKLGFVQVSSDYDDRYKSRKIRMSLVL
ncbi:N-acetyltransferase [bacterium]|nr:MAG: N-acetyltransferase [bacterium]